MARSKVNRNQVGSGGGGGNLVTCGGDDGDSLLDPDLVDKEVKDIQPSKMFTCVNCGHLSPQIYKTYALTSENLMKLLNCDNCGELVDKYIEYDVIIVAVNLLLLNQPAYRHALLNHSFNAFWKLGIIFPFCEAYCHWCFQKGLESSPNTVDFYELENDFYRVLLRTLLGALAFHGFILLSAIVRSKMAPSKVRKNFSVLSVLKGTCMCGFFSIFELIALVWSFPRKDTQYFFIYGMQLLTNVQSYMATTTASGPTSYLIIGMSIWLKLNVLALFESNYSLSDQATYFHFLKYHCSLQHNALGVTSHSRHRFFRLNRPTHIDIILNIYLIITEQLALYS